MSDGVSGDGGRGGRAALWLDREMIERLVQAQRPVMAGSTLANCRSRLLRLSEAHSGSALAGGDPAGLSGQSQKHERSS